MRNLKLLALAMVVAAGACSDDSTPVDSKVPAKDGGPVGTDAAFPTTSLLKTVANKLKMPTTKEEYAYDYDGSGAKNKLGEINATLAGLNIEGFNFQTNVDEMLSSGDFVLLLEVFGKSLTSDTNAGVQAFEGAPKTGTTPDFSGSGEFTITATSATNLKLQGSITAGLLAVGPGQLIIPIPAGGDPASYPKLTVKKCRVEANVADSATSAMTNGKIYGVVPWTDVESQLFPAIQSSVNKAYKDAATAASVKAIMKQLFDKNSDGDITVDELKNSDILKLLLTPDVDTDGDNTKDAMSVGMGFTAVKASFTK